MSFGRPPLRGMPGKRPPKGWGFRQDNPVQRTPEGFTPGGGEVQPAGDPPADFDGTRPEWAVQWALMQMGYREGVDFEREPVIPGLGAGWFSLPDFYIPAYQLIIEVQGTYWHVKVGTEKQVADEIRRANAASAGLHMVFIDEWDCLYRPIESVQRALLYQDSWLLERV